jgi:RNA polymerase sigma-70 factor, ECF subfamily
MFMQERSARKLMAFLALRPRETCVADGVRLREIFDQQAAFVWRCLRHLGVPSADLEDATQEVFVVVHGRLGEYQERERLRAWLYAICVRVAQRHKRKAARSREHVTAEPPEMIASATQQLRIEQREALALGQRLLALLPEAQRAVFLLYEIERMPMAEVAAALGCPLQTAYARLHKARERVQAEVQRARERGELP